jgi:hypothetical protein
MLYKVKWEIELECNSPEQAARYALQIQRDFDSQGTYFLVTDEIGNEKPIAFFDQDSEFYIEETESLWNHISG